MNKLLLCTICVALLPACSGDGTTDGNGSDAGVDSSAPGDVTARTPDTDAVREDLSQEPAADTGDEDDAATSSDAGRDTNNQPDTAPVDMADAACDYRAVDDVVVIEAESLPLNEDWATESDLDGYSGDGYIWWTGSSHNNDPSHGVMEVAIQVTTPGRYQLQWHTRIGMGTNATEHNDAWVFFPDADDYYGLKGQPGAEIRRYARPQCDDDAFMDPIRALPDVETADCARGSTTDGWMKVYSSGATDWRWSARTSDNDASDVMAEFDSAGVYTLRLAARADYHIIDRIVLHLESVDDDTVRDLDLPETPCP